MAIAIATIIVSVLGMFTNALALQYLWGWFVTPFGIEQIGFVHAIGLNILLSLVFLQRLATVYTYCQENSDRDEKRALGITIGSMICGPILLTLIGYIVHTFM